MEQLLHRASQISDLSYLRMLQLVHAQAALLVEDLKAYELPTTSARSTADTSSAVEVRSISVTAAQGSNTSITAMLETAMEELFIRDIEGIRYLERESKSLTHLYVSLLSPFARYHVSYLKLLNHIFSLTRGQIGENSEDKDNDAGSCPKYSHGASLGSSTKIRWS